MQLKKSIQEFFRSATCSAAYLAAGDVAGVKSDSQRPPPPTPIQPIVKDKGDRCGNWQSAMTLSPWPLLQAIKKEANGSMMEVVLHDGAPNVGGVWASEAYSQSALVLDALKLATEFLVPNGTFVTKIFR